MALSKAAKKFKEEAKDVVLAQLSKVFRFPVYQDTVYGIHIITFFEKLENPGWFEFWKEDTYFKRGTHKGELKGRGGERKAKSRYKEIDYDNRIKFLQDCVVTAIGIPNDAQIFRGTGEKREDPDNPRATVRITLLDRSEFFKGEEGR